MCVKVQKIVSQKVYFRPNKEDLSFTQKLNLVSRWKVSLCSYLLFHLFQIFFRGSCCEDWRKQDGDRSPETRPWGGKTLFLKLWVYQSRAVAEKSVVSWKIWKVKVPNITCPLTSGAAQWSPVEKTVVGLHHGCGWKTVELVMQRTELDWSITWGYFTNCVIWKLSCWYDDMIKKKEVMLCLMVCTRLSGLVMTNSKWFKSLMKY